MSRKLLAEMTSIETMFCGNMSKRRQVMSGGEYFAVQCRRNGRNESRYVQPARRAAYEAAIAGYARFMELTERYVDAVIARTEREISKIKVVDRRTLRFAKTRQKQPPPATPSMRHP